MAFHMKAALTICTIIAFLGPFASGVQPCEGDGQVGQCMQDETSLLQKQQKVQSGKQAKDPFLKGPLEARVEEEENARIHEDEDAAVEDNAALMARLKKDSDRGEEKESKAYVDGEIDENEVARSKTEQNDIAFEDHNIVSPLAADEERREEQMDSDRMNEKTAIDNDARIHEKEEDRKVEAETAANVRDVDRAVEKDISNEEDNTALVSSGTDTSQAIDPEVAEIVDDDINMDRVVGEEENEAVDRVLGEEVNDLEADEDAHVEEEAHTVARLKKENDRGEEADSKAYVEDEIADSEVARSKTLENDIAFEDTNIVSPLAKDEERREEQVDEDKMLAEISNDESARVHEKEEDRRVEAETAAVVRKVDASMEKDISNKEEENALMDS